MFALVALVATGLALSVAAADTYGFNASHRSVASGAPVPQLPRSLLVRYDFAKRHTGGTTHLKRGGLLIFTRDEGSHVRYSCLGEKRLGELTERLGDVQPLPRSIAGQPFLARSQLLNIEWRDKKHVVYATKSQSDPLPNVVRRLIDQLTRLRHVLRPDADRLNESIRSASAKRLCDR